MGEVIHLINVCNHSSLGCWSIPRLCFPFFWWNIDLFSWKSSFHFLLQKDDQKKSDGEKATVVAADGGGKKEEGPITVVLNLDLHCEGCAKKVRRSVNHFQGTTSSFFSLKKNLCSLIIVISIVTQFIYIPPKIMF